MQKFLNRSTKQLPVLRRSKTNPSKSIPSISELVQNIDTQIQILNEDLDFDNILELATNLAAFCKTHFANQYTNLSFNTSYDDLNSFCGQICQILHRENLKVAHHPECSRDTFFIFEIPFNAQFYVLEAKFIHLMPNTALKIGFAHLFERFSINLMINSLALTTDFKPNFHDHIFENSIEFLSCNDDLTQDEIHLNQKMINHTYKQLKKSAKCLQINKTKNLNTFYNYQPRSNKNKYLKQIISLGLSLNFDALLAFCDSECENDYALSYINLFMALNDSQDPITNGFIEMHSDLANNGCSMPNGYYQYENGCQKYKTSPLNQTQLKDICQFVETFTTYLYTL